MCPLSRLAASCTVSMLYVPMLPTLRQLVKGGAVKWIARVGPTGRSPLMCATFVLRGGERRASELYAKLSGSDDARSWRVFNRNRGV